MSLVSTYVLADDGLYYQDPTIYGPNYFLCWDDDEPPELVIECLPGVKDKVSLRLVIAQLRERGLMLSSIVEDNQKSGRFFGSLKDYRQAHAWWVDVLKPIPRKLFDLNKKGIRLEGIDQGVIYHFGEV